MKIHLTDRIKPEEDFIILVQDMEKLNQTPLSGQEQEYEHENYIEGKRETFFFNRLSQFVFVHFCKPEPDAAALEKLRKKGDELVASLTKEKKSQAVIFAAGVDTTSVLALAEGMALGAYKFVKHKKPDDKQTLFHTLKIAAGSIGEEEVAALQNIVTACYETRHLVNEPGNVVDAVAFAQQMRSLAEKAGVRVDVFDKEKIKELGMEALLTVNKGSKTEPSFTVMEWKPENAVNAKPVVLVGKGLVFDTGGINIKPTKGLEEMKCDMAGGAAVFGAVYAAAMNKLPVHIVGLVPATDNRPGEHAMLPGDIIRLSNGKTVEILNTDAEGRLILADALLYAQKYDPELVIDLATLTGSAQMAIGKYGMAGMHQDAAEAMEKLKQSGWNVYERIAELPFWEEYGEEMESDIADLRNIGKGGGGGAITAGKFLAHFISYPWIHLDIAGVAFMDSRDSYRGKGATGVGVRLLYDFLRKMADK